MTDTKHELPEIDWTKPVAVKVRNIRNKPEPIELWVNVYPDGPAARVYKSEDEADRGAFDGRIRCVRMREVLEND
jgi:hypothetical protein